MTALVEAPPLQVLHVVSGRDSHGGTMAFAVGLASQPMPGLSHRVWKSRHYVPPQPGASFVCQGLIDKTDVGPMRDLLGGLAEAAPLWSWVAKNKPVILHAHSRLGMVAGALASTFARVPLILNFHFRARRPGRYRRILSWTKATPVFNSRATCEHYGCDPKRALILMPPIRWPSAAPPSGAPRTRFVMASTYVRWKNLHLAIEAFHRLTAQGSDAQLVIYGRSSRPLDPVYQGEVIALAGSNPRILLAEYDPAWTSRLCETDIFVHAAQEEPFGIVILEALARGCRLVVPSGTFLDDLPAPAASDGVFRAEALTPGELLGQMKRALASPPDGKGYWQKRQSLSALFSWESISRRLLPVYQALSKREQTSA